jgi:hypothetical protein
VKRSESDGIMNTNIFTTDPPEPAFMGDKKRNTITFDPDPDVAEELLKKLRAMGNPYGMRSKICNDALRDYLRDFDSKVRAWSVAMRGKAA